MAITNTFTSGTQAQAAQVNENFRDTKWSPSFYSHTGLGIANAIVDTLVHSSTTWTRLNGTSTKRTTDSGANWSDVTTDVVNMEFGKVSDADGTKAIAFLDANLNVAISSDSGDTWAQASADPADQPYCLSFPTATVAVMGTAKSAGARGIYFSTDAGDNWTICTSGPTVAVLAISMFNATTGFAIADAGAIWKTTDGGDNWTDTTHSTTDPLSGIFILVDILAISTTEFVSMNLFLSGTGVRSMYYDSSGSPTISFQITSTASIARGNPFNPIKLTNGDFIYGFYVIDDNNVPHAKLFKNSAKDSTNAEIMELQTVNISDQRKITTILQSSALAEYDTNKIMVVTRSGYFLLDETAS